MPVFMLPAVFADLSLGLWLLARAKRLPEMVGDHTPSGTAAQA
jgi:hypothetical protein